MYMEADPRPPWDVAARMVGLSLPYDRIDDVASSFSQFKTCHDVTRCLASPSRSHEISLYLGKSKAHDWLSHMAIALAIAKQKAIPFKYP